MSKLKRVGKISPASNVILNIVFIFCFLLCVVPLLLVIIASMTDEKTIALYGYSLFPKKYSMAAYEYVFSRGSTIFRAYCVSIFVTLVGTAASVLMVALYAYPLSRSNFRYKNFFSFFIYFTMLFSGGLVPWVMVYTQFFKLSNTLPIMIIPYLMSAWYVLVLRTFMKSGVPEEVVESARIDGASEIRIFFTIVIPLSVAGLATIALFAMLGYWNDWYLPLIYISDSKLYNIQYLMYTILMNAQYLSSMASNNANLGSAVANMPTETIRMAVAVIAIGPIIFAYPFFQKYFIQGLTIGAVKG